jgi:hypothetical protein
MPYFGASFGSGYPPVEGQIERLSEHATEQRITRAASATPAACSMVIANSPADCERGRKGR